jgi:NAD(P)-dependent dehydrogenase (short-subunit alcohol dehydrogenase family)
MRYLEKLFSLEGKLAVVTGGSRGLGKGMAEALLNAGAEVILVSADENRLRATTDEFAAAGLKATCQPCDLSSAEDIEQLCDTIEGAHDRLDILVNAAGVTSGWDDVLQYPDEAWERTLKINLEAPFRLCRRLGRLMTQEGGSIINITSLAAERGAPDNPAYGAAKGGLKSMTRSLAVSLGKHGIRVNNIGPGYIQTDMTGLSWNNPELRERRRQSTILKRWGQPDDLAGVVVLLASEASSYITGQDLYVDGGWLSNFD